MIFEFLALLVFWVPGVNVLFTGIDLIMEGAAIEQSGELLKIIDTIKDANCFNLEELEGLESHDRLTIFHDELSSVESLGWAQ